MKSVAVTGATGYAGGEILRLLAGHGEVEVTAVTASDASVGTKLAQAHPNLAGHRWGDLDLQASTPEVLAEADVVFLALPHGTSAGIAAELDQEQLLIDCGADHRLIDAQAWQEFYGSEHAGTWPYGLPELPGQREQLAGAKRIAVPGCYPTTATLALVPGLAAGLVEPQNINVVAMSGTSGAGKAAKPHLLNSEITGSLTPYSVGGTHRHIPEIEQNLKVVQPAMDSQVTFTPVLAPMSRGILAVCQAPTSATADDLRVTYVAAYSDEPFVTVLCEGEWPQTKSTYGSNQVHIQVAVDKRTGTAIMISALDNLVKGTAGGAIQSMNLALGLPEATGLTSIGVAP